VERSLFGPCPRVDHMPWCQQYYVVINVEDSKVIKVPFPTAPAASVAQASATTSRSSAHSRSTAIAIVRWFESH
jgi:hypothetical protein